MEIDYAAWVARAQAFTEGLARLVDAEVHSSGVLPPVAEPDLQAIEGALGRTLPASLRAFFARGAAGLDCHYAYEPDGEALARLHEALPDETRIYGGARLGSAAELPDLSRSVSEWAEDTWVAEAPDQKAIWQSALPFTAIDNGDYLALDLRTGEADPPVVYLNHEDDSSVIAGSFDAFLRAWEALCYIGPEYWLLLEFTGAEGYLEPDSDRATRLRRLLGS